MKKWPKSKIFKYLTDMEMKHRDGLTVYVRKDPNQQSTWILFIVKDKPKMEIIDHYDIQTVYQLYQTNFLLKKKYGLHDYLFSYAQQKEGDTQAGWDFTDRINDYIIYNE